MESKLEDRAKFAKEISRFSPENIIYIDESGIDLSARKEFAWGRIGEIISDKKNGKYYEKINIIAGTNCGQAVAPMIFSGSCDTKLFNYWLENHLIKILQKDQVVVMDNASFHKSKTTKLLIESVGCKLIFLPPYSPDLNPIEKFWSKMKRWIKQNIQELKGDIYESIFKFSSVPSLN